MAGLGIAFVSRYAIKDEVRARRLRVVAVEKLKIQRHFHDRATGERLAGARSSIS